MPDLPTLSAKPLHNKPVAFVTGATGLVGAHVVEALVQHGQHVKALYRSDVPAIKGGDKVEWVQGDVLDIVGLEEALAGVQHVYHCAAIVSFDPKRKREMMATNVNGTINVVNAALNCGVERLCHVSSVAALGQRKSGSQIAETMNWADNPSKSDYGKSKYLAEAEVWRGIGEGLAAVIVNPTIILGAGKWNESSTKIFRTAYNEFPWYTTGVAGFVDVNDVAQAMLQLMEAGISGEKFILNGENRTYQDVFSLIATAFGKHAPQKRVSPFMAEVVWRLETIKGLLAKGEPLLSKETAQTAQASFYYDSSKIKKALPGFAFTPLETAIARICGELREKYNL